MRERTKQVFKKIFAKELLSHGSRIYYLAQRGFGNTERCIITKYFSTHGIRKLHIGCSTHILEGWLNSDLFPESKNILHLDATRPFSFRNEEFDYIFNEHMIEHILYESALYMLRECYRVLKKNGKIRISTPSLAFLIDLYTDNKSSVQKRYIERAAEASRRNIPHSEDVFVINNFFRDWGHQFIYDEKALFRSLEQAGFAGIIKCEINESKVEELRNLENDKRMPEGFLALETITLEGTKL